MSKKITPLEALERIGTTLLRNYDGSVGMNGYTLFQKELDIIETALKKLEQIEEISFIISGGRMSSKTPIALKVMRQLKALEIIKKYPKCSLAHLITYECAKRKGYSVGSLDINDIPYTQEEYDIVIQELEELVEERLKRF